LVAIAALVAVIMAPNIEVSRGRSDASRVAADLHTMAVAIEGYTAYNGVQPRTYRPSASWSRSTIMAQLTTPMA
jgi:hypothetical protein